MSGGTDSSMAAIYLQEQGFDVHGITFLMFLDEIGEQPAFISEAKSLAVKLGIHHYICDVRDAFHQTVIAHFVDEYKNGRTPNPCIYCNENFKWKLLAEKADELGIVKIATGHYAQIVNYNGQKCIAKGEDVAKDQSYFLYRLPQQILERAVFPLGKLTKKAIKDDAEQRGLLKLASKKESMGICFLKNQGIASLLSKYIPTPELGDVVDVHGTVLGSHSGYYKFTVGQKKGLEGIIPLDCCVTAINSESNKLIVGATEKLMVSTVLLTDCIIHDQHGLGKNILNIRVRGIDSVPFHLGSVTIRDNNSLLIKFEQPVWNITPGQSVVIYDDNRILAGGIA